MISIRPYEPERDRVEIERWWDSHKTPPIQSDLLPRGWIAEGTSVALAVSFLYMDPGKLGVIEWTTTNPACAMSYDTVRAVKALYDHLEREAVSAGCRAVLSFVKPGSWEERTMAKRGYGPIGGAHTLFAKFPKKEEECP